MLLQINSEFAEINESPEARNSFIEEIITAVANNLYNLDPDMMGLDGSPCFPCVMVGLL
jgi:hypothetical protein